MFYLKTRSTHSIYGYMASDIWNTQSKVEKIRCRHYMDYSFRLAERYFFICTIPQTGNTCNYPCYASRGALVRTRNTSRLRDRSDDPSYHENRLYHGAISRFLGERGEGGSPTRTIFRQTTLLPRCYIKTHLGILTQYCNIRYRLVKTGHMASDIW